MPVAVSSDRNQDPDAKRRKVLFVSKAYYPTVGGMENHLRMMGAVVADRYDVEIVARDFGGRDSPMRRLANRVLKRAGYDSRSRQMILARGRRQAMDGKVRVRSAAPTMRQRLSMLLTRGRSATGIYNDMFARLLRPGDIVHSIGIGFLGEAAAAGARAQHAGFVITPYLHHFDQQTPWFVSADRVFALLDTDADLLVRHGIPRDRIRMLPVVPTAFPAGDPIRFRQQRALGPGQIVLFVGRMVTHKGADVVAHAARLVWESAPDVQFVFAGPPGNMPLDVLADAADPRLRYIGPISEAEKADAMVACDLFCMPSSSEVLPTVFLEAWSCGKPVIGGPAYGLKELIEGNGAGIVVEQDPQRLAEGILSILRDRETARKMGEAGRRLVERRYSAEALRAQLEQTYAELAE